MRIPTPPRQQPASIRSPGTRSAITLSTQRLTFRRRSRPTIVGAYCGPVATLGAGAPGLDVHLLARPRQRSLNASRANSGGSAASGG